MSKAKPPHSTTIAQEGSAVLAMNPSTLHGPMGTDAPTPGICESVCSSVWAKVTSSFSPKPAYSAVKSVDTLNFGEVKCLYDTVESLSDTAVALTSPASETTARTTVATHDSPHARHGPEHTDRAQSVAGDVTATVGPRGGERVGPVTIAQRDL